MDERTSIEVIRADFVERYTRRAPFAEDRALSEEISLQAAPVIEALRMALSSEHANDLGAPEYREGFALVGLLGRRAGTLQATPTAGLALIDGLAAALRQAGFELKEDAETALGGAFFEGFVAGREDGLVERAQKQLSLCQPIVEIAPGLVALMLAGRHEAESLIEVTERFGRALLRANAQSCLVDMTGLEEPTPSRAAAVFGIDETARMLGTKSVFVANESWRAAARGARAPVEMLRFVDTFEQGIATALQGAGYVLRKRRIWDKFL